MDYSQGEPGRPCRGARAACVAAIDRGVRYLAAVQAGDGIFRSMRSVDPLFTKWVPVGEGFLTLYMLCSLRTVRHGGLRDVRARAARAMLHEMIPPGLWRFLTVGVHEQAPYPWPADADSLAIGPMALSRYRPSLLLRRSIGHLQKWRDDQGRFLTWVEETQYINPVCPGTNADVVWYVGDAACTKPVVGWLVDIVTGRTDEEHQVWYPGPMHLNYLVSRAARESAPTLRPLYPVLAERVVKSVGEDASQDSALSAAQALCTLARIGEVKHRLAHALAERLVQTQVADGSWPAAPAYCGRLSDAVPGIPAQPLCYWGSPALTTAVALEALALALAGAG